MWDGDTLTGHVRDLHIEAGWSIECYRCSNEAFCAADSETPIRDRAAVFFYDIGWRIADDGFQTCPRCSP